MGAARGNAFLRAVRMAVAMQDEMETLRDKSRRYPGAERYPLARGIEALSLPQVLVERAGTGKRRYRR
jgi:hypothetical protein